MRRVSFIILFVLVGLIGVMAILPLFFKNSISDQLKIAINKQIEGTVDFSEFHISLFNKFPKVELQVVGLSIAGTGDFQHDTLVSVGSVSGAITLSELFRKKELKITSLNIRDTDVLLKTIEGGAANWDIVPSPGTEEAVEEPESDTSGKGIKIMFDDLELSGLNLKYLDESSDMLFILKNSSTHTRGEISGSEMNFDIEAQVGELIFEYGSVRYISNTKLRLASQLLFNSEKMDFTFSDGNIWLNDLLLKLEGSFAIPSDSMYFDLNLNNDSKDFKGLLALVPAAYESYLEKVQADGSATISGNFKGWYYGEDYPALQLNLEVADGTFKYTGMPEQIDHIRVSTQISKPQGDFDKLVIDVPKASASLKGIPVNLQMKITTPVSDPAYAARLQGDVNFNMLNKAVPMEGVDIQGELSADIAVEGRQSDVDKSAYDKFKSNGKLSLENFVYRSEALKEPVNIQSGVVSVTTPKIEVKSLKGNIGQSHFSLTGYLSDYLPYFLRDKVLKGEFILKSNFADLTELAAIQNQVATQKADSAIVQQTTVEADSILAFEVPARMNLKFRSAIKKAVYDRMELSQVNGLIAIHDQTLELGNLDMEMLQGKLTVTGSYKGNEQLRPDFDFNLDAADFDVQSAYQSLSMVRRYLPIAARSQGKISTEFSMKGKMNEKMELIGPSLNGNGVFSTHQLKVVDDPTLSQLKGIIKSEKLKKVKVDDFTARFNIENGNLIVEPFYTTIAGQETTVQGKLSVQSELDFLLDFKLNRSDLGDDINKVFDFIPGSQNIQKVDTGVKITGPVKSPKVSVDLDNARKQIMEEVKKAGTKEVKDKVKKIGNELKKLFR